MGGSYLLPVVALDVEGIRGLLNLETVYALPVFCKIGLDAVSGG